MKMLPFALAAVALTAPAFAQTDTVERARRAATAKRTTIVRDDWGIAHIHGPTDADAVFGMIYAQAEDDFNRIETNYLVALGRLAEAEGEKALWQDLRQRLFVDPVVLRQHYADSPAWLQALMRGWADGLNYYLATHPAVRPRAIKHFEPWMALAFSEGSIGGDIERVRLGPLAAFYGGKQLALNDPDSRAYREPQGSNGIAIAPSRTKDGHALLLINPHTSFFFRAEQQVSSDEGLNAYGAATWGQFFIYQGFNAHAGWMHTSSGVDSVDEFAETIIEEGGKRFYRYGGERRALKVRPITLSYRLADGTIATRRFTTYATHHGPITRADGGKWIAFALMNKPMAALEQSFLRTKATDLASFLKVAEQRANSSNNTLFADDKGAIAYLHPPFVPKRNNRIDYTKPVDGSDPATDWQGLHTLDDLPQAVSPKSGWVMNTNDWPWSAAGPDSPKASAFPRYMDTAGENPRGLHATALLAPANGLTIEGLRALAFDSHLNAFDPLIPDLVAAWEAMPEGAERARLAQPVALLKGWDRRWAADSVATSLAIFWGEALWGETIPDLQLETAGLAHYRAMEAASPARKLKALGVAIDRLTADFGSAEVPWGEINRFQRNDAAIVQKFDDSQPSTPVAFASAQWGSLASFGARAYPGTKRYYGTSGNSFVAVVEFGPRVRAVAVTAGGESGDPTSKHFNDQATRYATGDLRPVYFWPDEMTGHIERQYHPGR
jgi:acyl-homoserine-lactone acylase